MTRFFTRLLGRLPIGWLQLVHNKTRLAAAVAGVTFCQPPRLLAAGVHGRAHREHSSPYDILRGDIMVSASDANTLSDGSPLPRQRMYEAMGVDGVHGVIPLYLGKLDWRQGDGTQRTLDVIGFDPSHAALDDPEIEATRPLLNMPNTAVIDRKTRNVKDASLAEVSPARPLVFEARDETLTIIDTFSLGGGFSGDGYLVVSDETFFRLFPQRTPGAPNHLLVRLDEGTTTTVAAPRLSAALPDYDASVRTLRQAIAKDQKFQLSQKPVGLIFGFGVVIGALVGVVIVYQVLATDVADHIKEYATFKAIGYPHRFFLGIIFEEAVILAVLGFIPGVLLSLLLYAGVSRATGLPVGMTLGRAVAVFLGTVIMCSLSGAIATRRLARANPAELF